MRDFYSINKNRPVYQSLHFWIIVAITIFLIFIYPLWPWREWQFTDGIWQWLSWLSSLRYLALFESSHHLIGSLFLLPIIYATIVFKWYFALVVFLVSFVGLWNILPGYWINPDTGLANISILLLPVLVMLAIQVELELRRRDKKDYIERERERQLYLSKITQAQEKERQHLSEELHDQSIQTLLAVASYAESVELSDQDINEIKTKAALIKEQTRSTVDELRRLSTSLRPGILDDMGLIPALKWFTNHIANEKHIQIQLGIKGPKSELTSELELNVFRIVQEALHNIVRHARASEAFINLDMDTEFLKITIKDNGQGFIPPKKFASFVTKGKLGLAGMQERVKSLGGTFEVQSNLDEGTLLIIEIPVHNESGFINYTEDLKT
jgi:two-component system, NarL family, sensor histidine kinase DegS